MIIPPRYHHSRLVIMRSSTGPGDLEVPAHLDLYHSAVVVQDGRAWLASVRTRNDVREAQPNLSSSLAAHVDTPLGSAAASAPGVRRAIVSTVSALVRWLDRPTPLRLSAGIAIAETGAAAALRHLALAGAR